MRTSASLGSVKLAVGRADAASVARRSPKRAHSRARRITRLATCVCIALVAGISIFVGWSVQLGLIQNPLAPVIRGDLVSARSDREGLRVLFVGNSFTYYNSMPALVQRLASADEGAQPIIVSMTRGAWTLERFSRDHRLAALLKDIRWDVVILQEQSQLLSFSPESRRPGEGTVRPCPRDEDRVGGWSHAPLHDLGV